MAKVLCVAGARPNFPKIAPIMRALATDARFEPVLLHTGQHYDDRLSKVFFEQLSIPKPDIDLNVGSGSHAQQTAEIMQRFEGVLDQVQPQVVIVVGDVNSTVACALVTAKFHLADTFVWNGGTRTRPIMVHVEAGLRSRDDDMPEEINRRVTDALSDLLFTTEASASSNLVGEGIGNDKIHFVGNVMIDTLMAAKQRAMESSVVADMELQEGGYGLLTLHRPSNVDVPAQLKQLLGVLDDIAKQIPLVFPVHPRTRSKLHDAGIALDSSRWTLVEPVGYLEFLRLMSSARIVCSDSGGIQEETTILGVPCLTLRDNTERPITIDEGTNVLAGTTRDTIWPAFEASMVDSKKGRRPALWDGQAAGRIVEVIGGLLRRE